MKKIVSCILLATLFVSMFALAISIKPVGSAQLGPPSSRTTTVPDDYPTIQAAINAASDGDTIFVRNGTYNENVVVNKSLTMRGENANNTVILAGEVNVLTIVADNVTVSGFNIQGVPSYDGCSVYLESSGNRISQNIIMNNYNGIKLWSSAGNLISENRITRNNYGIVLYDSSHNSIRENEVIGSEYGIFLQESSFNNVSMNVLDNNLRSIMVYESFNNSIAQNTITRNMDYGIWLGSSEYNTISENNVTLNWGPSPDEGNGIWLFGSSLNVISNNLVANNVYGIRLDGSTYNNVLSNTLLNNYQYGIWLYWAGGNSILHNNFVNNGIQAYSQGNVLNDWNNTCEGNYWSDYDGVDECGGPYQNITGSDGIGDTPYTMYAYLGPKSQDNYPLMNPWIPPDIAVTNVSVLKTRLVEGQDLSIMITVANQGNKIEAFNVTAFLNDYPVESFRNVLLKGGASIILNTTWGLTRVYYTASAYIPPLTDEINTSNNAYTSVTVLVAPFARFRDWSWIRPIPL